MLLLRAEKLPWFLMAFMNFFPVCSSSCLGMGGPSICVTAIHCPTVVLCLQTRVTHECQSNKQTWPYREPSHLSLQHNSLLFLRGHLDIISLTQSVSVLSGHITMHFTYRISKQFSPSFSENHTIPLSTSMTEQNNSQPLFFHQRVLFPYISLQSLPDATCSPVKALIEPVQFN